MYHVQAYRQVFPACDNDFKVNIAPCSEKKDLIGLSRKSIWKYILISSAREERRIIW